MNIGRRMSMALPSGRKYNQFDLRLVTQMHKHGFIRLSDEPFKLNSGIDSRVYVYGREDVTDNPLFERNVGRKIANLVQKYSLLTDKQPCLIGLPTAGTALAQAASAESLHNGIFVNGKPICHRVMRQMLKSHGAHPKWVNGDADQGHTYWTIDNVITNGDSKFTANKRLRQDGYPVHRMPSLILVDRQQGGIEKLREAGFERIVVGYYLLDLAYAFGELGLWPKSAVKAVKEEIAAHQFL